VPTFSIPTWSKYFLISDDGGETYQEAGSITVNYYAINKMVKGTYTSSENPLRIAFKRSDIQDDYGGVTVTRILVNQASTFDSPWGDGVTSIGNQSTSSGGYLAGRYAIYNSGNGVDTGSLNFSDFKMAPITTSTTTTDMQMVFFVTGEYIPVTVKGGYYEATYDEHDSNGNWVATITCFISLNVSSTNRNSGSREYTTNVEKNQTSLTIYVTVDYSFSHNSYSSNGGGTRFNYKFKDLDVLGTEKFNEEGTMVGPYGTTIPINGLVWTADPEIHVYLDSGTFSAKTAGGDTVYFGTPQWVKYGN
jgi:hypothetical protein